MRRSTIVLLRSAVPCAVMLACGSDVATANDASAYLGAGGIELRPTRRVSLERETLHVSPEEVTVEYEFRTRTRRDVTLTVAFPLPVLTFDYTPIFLPVATPVADDGIDFVGFKAWSDDQEIAWNVEQRAYLKGRDVTAILKANGLHPLAFYAPVDFEAAVAGLSAVQRRDLLAKGIFEEYGEFGFQPLYEVRTTFFWEQTFPRRSITRIRHRYSPVAGSYYGLPDGEDAAATCIDRLAPAVRSDADTRCGLLRTVEYVLRTARTWRGPIDRFELCVSGGAELYTCWPGLVPSGPGQWTYSATKFVPERDLTVGLCVAPITVDD